MSFLRIGEALTDFVESAFEPPAPKRPQLPLYVRPPGALAEKDFLNACTRCDDCIKACPHFVIRKAGPELGFPIAETPILLPKENPCLMCEGFPCIAACEPKALRFPENDFTPIGIAVVSSSACYMGQGQPCDYCVNDCPETPKAIEANTQGEPALVDSERCTGCGKCAQICPANAIEIEPR